jgi:outer membrane protein TolC
VLPAVTASADFARYSIPTFNIGTGELQRDAAAAQITAQYDVFTGGRKFAALRAARAQHDVADADAQETRYLLALATEGDYYAVVADEELARVAAERVTRAEEQLSVARARVLSGAAVQTDSLQLLLEVTRARLARLQQGAALRASRSQLGRRVGIAGPVRAAPLDTTAMPPLPFSLEDAVRRALVDGPTYRTARAQERVADADLAARRGAYLPRVTLSASAGAFDDHFFPEASTRTVFGLTVSLPLWNGAQRELDLSRARVLRDVARAVRADLERAAWRDVAEAYDAYHTARAAAALAGDAVRVGRENFRVQQIRYRGGATTILDLVDAQVSLTEAEAGLVQARFAARLALAGLEAILGTRLDSSKDTQ